MNKSLAILAAAALFASGLAIGALSVHLFYSQKIVGAGGPPMPVEPVFERWLLRHLDLSAEQRGQVREILERSRVEAEELRRNLGPRLRAMNRRTADDLAEILTSEQRERLEEFMARREQRRRRFRDGDGPPRDRRFGPQP